MANKRAQTWVPLVVIISVTVVVLCFCLVFAVFYCVWQERDVGTAREDAGAVEGPGGEVERPGTVAELETSEAAGVTLANFDRIKTGMTYAEVCDIFGCEGTPKKIEKSSSGRPETRHYEWYDREGGSAYLRFQEGRVISAWQFDLQ